MATGRILQFDQGRGYGFISAEDGGEDVFLHASVFDGNPDWLVPGVRVEFQTVASDRGRKAYRAHVASEEVTRPAPSDGPEVPAVSAEEPMCDVLSPAEFGQEITELLLSAVPELTGHQVIGVRQNMLEFAKKHGWSDG
jgi:cold shock protein